jgi:protein pelota
VSNLQISIPKPVRTQLHVSGKIENENKYTQVGQYHTLDLEMHRNFTLEKEVESKDGEQGLRARVEKQGWDSIAREQLKETNNLQKKAEVVAVVMQEVFTNICFVTQYQHDSSAESRAGRAKEVGFTKSHGKGAFSYLAYHKRSLWHYSGIALTVSPLVRLVLA